VGVVRTLPIVRVFVFGETLPIRSVVVLGDVAALDLARWGEVQCFLLTLYLFCKSTCRLDVAVMLEEL